MNQQIETLGANNSVKQETSNIIEVYVIEEEFMYLKEAFSLVDSQLYFFSKEDNMLLWTKAPISLNQLNTK